MTGEEDANAINGADEMDVEGEATDKDGNDDDDDVDDDDADNDDGEEDVPEGLEKDNLRELLSGGRGKVMALRVRKRKPVELASLMRL